MEQVVFAQSRPIAIGEYNYNSSRDKCTGIYTHAGTDLQIQ
jgi:hypothetical protein